MKLNLGCGYDYREGFVNIDACPETKPDYVMILGEKSLLDYFKPESFSYIFAQDIVEHLFRYEAIMLLYDCYKLLKNHGKIRIRVPNFDSICANSSFSSEEKINYIFGGQQRGVEDLPSRHCHKYVYTKDTIRNVLKQASFKNEKVFPGGGTNLTVEAIKDEG